MEVNTERKEDGIAFMWSPRTATKAVGTNEIDSQIELCIIQERQHMHSMKTCAWWRHRQDEWHDHTCVISNQKVRPYTVTEVTIKTSDYGNCRMSCNNQGQRNMGTG